MKRIYHNYTLWEDYKNNFYSSVKKSDLKKHRKQVFQVLSEERNVLYYMKKVINEWEYSCNHNLSNFSMNRIAWLGQAACCIAFGIPSFATMNIWNEIEPIKQEYANNIAKSLIKEWELKRK